MSAMGGGAPDSDAAKEALKKPENLLGTLSLDPIALKTGRNLVPLIDPNQDGPLLERITLVRYHIGQELGFVIPGVRVMDDLSLPPNQYEVEIRGNKIATGTALMNHHFVQAMVEDLQEKGISGEEAKDPSTGEIYKLDNNATLNSLFKNYDKIPIGFYGISDYAECRDNIPVSKTGRGGARVIIIPLENGGWICADTQN
jgi:flagellar biosynthesis component FlhA